MRRVICFVLASAMLIGGLRLLYLQFFVWPATRGFVMAMTGFLIAIGSAWLIGDFVVPLFRRR